eukprot:gene6265-7792_t
MTYGHRRAPFGNQARLSTDNGKTWGEAMILSGDGKGGDLGYPSTVELADGSFLTVWYESMKEPEKAVLRQANLASVLLGLSSLRALDIQAQGSNIVVRSIATSEPVTLAIAPAPVLEVRDEPLKLSADAPVGWSKGTRLRACNAHDVNASGSFVPGSLEIRRSKGGELLKEGEDYLVDEEWGHVGIGPKSRVTVNDAVFASYRYSRRRMDTVQVDGQGRATLKQ